MNFEAEPQLQQKGETYEAIFSQAEITDVLSAPLEVREKMNIFHINTEWKEEIKSLKLPQFFIAAPLSLFDENKDAFLHPANLAENFTLKNKDTNIDFTTLDADMVQVDMSGNLPKIPLDKIPIICYHIVMKYYTELLLGLSFSYRWNIVTCFTIM